MMTRPTIPVDGGQEVPAAGRDAIPRRWTLDGMNNGTIFGATRRGVAVLPRVVSYAIGDAGTWLAWRLMRETRGAIAANLRPIFPEESERALERRARELLGAYARDVIDRKSTRLNSSHSQISYAVFCLKKKRYCIRTQSY